LFIKKRLVGGSGGEAVLDWWGKGLSILFYLVLVASTQGSKLLFLFFPFLVLMGWGWVEAPYY
jgi:hypothetical protein